MTVCCFKEGENACAEDWKKGCQIRKNSKEPT